MYVKRDLFLDSYPSPSHLYCTPYDSLEFISNSEYTHLFRLSLTFSLSLFFSLCLPPSLSPSFPLCISIYLSLSLSLLLSLSLSHTYFHLSLSLTFSLSLSISSYSLSLSLSLSPSFFPFISLYLSDCLFLNSLTFLPNPSFTDYSQYISSFRSGLMIGLEFKTSIFLPFI